MKSLPLNFGQEKPHENKIEVADKIFGASEIGFGLDELKNANWVNDLVRHYESSHKGLGNAIYLVAMSAISASLPPIPYRGEPQRSKLHILLRGQHGGGKGFLMGLVKNLCANVQEEGAATSAAVMGGVDKDGRWIEGKAYRARHGVLIIRELFQSLRSGEHFENLAFDLNEILEFPHMVSKTNIGYNIKEPDVQEQEHLGVHFPRSNEFCYEAPCAVIAGVPEISLFDLLAKISEGFMSRFIEVPIGYDRIEAVAGIENWWKNVLPGGRENTEMMKDSDTQLEQRFRRCFYMLHSANMGRWYDLRKIMDIRGFLLSDRIRNMFEQESVRAFNRAIDILEKSFEEGGGKLSLGSTDIESVRPPILFREIGDMLRIACCDSVSRRFAAPNSTEHEPGWVRIDDQAANRAVQFLDLIAETSVNNILEARKIRKLSRTQKPVQMWLEYELIREYGHSGIPIPDYYVILETKYKISKRRAETRLKKMIKDQRVEERSGVLYSTLATRLISSFKVM